MGARRDVDMDMKEQDGTNLIDKVISDGNLWSAYEKARKNKCALGIDGITVYQLKADMQKYYQHLKRKLKDGSFQPQPVRRVPFPKPDGSKRYLLCTRPSGPTVYSSGNRSDH